MKYTFWAAVVILSLALVSACSTFSGDRLLKLPEQTITYNQDSIILKAKNGVSAILDSFGVPEEIKASFENIFLEKVISDSEPLELTHIFNQLVISRADVNISSATDSIIVTTGNVHISHSNNNVVVCGSDIDISHDGNTGKGSLVISKGKIEIGHARSTLIYAIKGVKISFATDVSGFNTLDRKTSWGHINNIIIKPLFQEEIRSSKIWNDH